MRQHPLLQLEEPIISLNGGLWTANQPKTAEGTFLGYRGRAYELEPIGPAPALDFLYLKRETEEFERFKQEFIRGVRQTELHSPRDILATLSNDSLIQLIVGSVLPKLSGERLNNDLDRLIKAESQSRIQGRTTPGDTDLPPSESQAQPLIDREGTLAREVINDLHLDNAMTRSRCHTLGQLLDHGHSSLENFDIGNFMKINGTVYRLVEVQQYILSKIPTGATRARSAIAQIDPSEGIETFIEAVHHLDLPKTDSVVKYINGPCVRFGARNLIPEYHSTGSALQTILETTLKDWLKVEAAYQYEAQLQGITRRREIERRFRTIIGRDTYEENDAGFEKTHQGYYVYVKTGAYDIAWRNATYRFPSATVGVHVSGSGNAITVQPPIVLNSYKHPFLSGQAARTRICLGRFQASEFNALSPDEKIVALISKGVEVLKYGYRGPTGYSAIDGGYFDDYKITRAEARLNPIGNQTDQTNRTNPASAGQSARRT